MADFIPKDWENGDTITEFDMDRLEQGVAEAIALAIAAQSPASLPPNGPAGGALDGNYPNPGLSTYHVDQITGGRVNDASSSTGVAVRNVAAAAVAAVVGAAPAELDTLKEISDRLAQDSDAFSVLNGLIAAKASPADITAAIDALDIPKTAAAFTSAVQAVPGFGGGTGSASIPRRFSIMDHGAKMDAILLTNVVTVAGQPTVSSSSRPFTSADVGKTIAVMGAGPVMATNDGVWISTIQSVSGGTATLASNATSSGSGRRCIFGTPDDAAFAAAQNAAIATNGISFGLTGGTVYIPPGRTIVTVPLPVKNYVSWKGEHREQSWVHVVQDSAGTASASGFSDWLTCVGRDETNPLIGAEFADFGIEAEAHIHTAGYGASIKPLNIYHVKRCSIRRMNVWNAPVTAVPFDHSYDQCTIEDNYILRPGRLGPAGIGPGASGIGAGTKGTGATDPTLISGNVIVGTWSATVAGPGHNGIFTEAQGGADPDAGTNGYRIVNNLVIGMYYGISDTGSNGTIIQGNVALSCRVGIAVRKTTLSGSYPGLSTSIIGNVCRGNVGPSASDGIGILISQPTSGTIRRDVNTIVHSNQVIDNQSWGIYVNIQSGATVDFAGISILGNEIARNGRSGIRLAGDSNRKLYYTAIKDNQINSNGKAGLAGDQAGIMLASGTVMVGGRIQDNDIWDLATTKTQLFNIVTTGATLTDVFVSGNTAEVAADTTAPTVPGTPVATGNAGSIGLSWTGSTDAVGVSGYRIYRSNAPTTVLATTGSTTYTDSTATVGTAYTYTVSAYDAAGNESSKSPSSNSATATSSGDVTAPTVPGTPVATGGTNQVSLTWAASTDAVGVTSYHVYRSDAPTTSIGSPTTNTYADTTAVVGTAYTYTVDARDAAGNASAKSASSNSATATAGSSNIAYDTFTDTAGTSLGTHTGELGTPWIKNTGSNLGAMTISPSGTVYPGTANPTTYHPTATPAGANYTVEADLVFVSSVASQNMGIVARASTSSTDRYFFRYSVGQVNWGVVRTSAALSPTSATIGTTLAATLTPGQTYHMVLTVNGDTITATVDGTQVTSVTDTALQTTGAAGITASTAASTATTGMHLDNFKVHP